MILSFDRYVPIYFQDNEIVTVKTEMLVPEAMEFPRIDNRFLGKEYKFFYALGNDYLHPNKVRSGHFYMHNTCS